MTAILNEDPPDLVRDRPLDSARPRAHRRSLSREEARRRRFQTASDLAFALEALSDASGARSPRVERCPASRAGAGAMDRRGRIAALLLAGARAARLSARVASSRPRVEPDRGFRFLPPSELAGPGNFSLSPDGRHLAFFGLGADGIAAALDARPWIRWTSGRCRHRACLRHRRLPRSGHPTAASSRSRRGRQAQEARRVGRSGRRPCAICREWPSAARGIATATSSSGTRRAACCACARPAAPGRR